MFQEISHEFLIGLRKFPTASSFAFSWAHFLFFHNMYVPGRNDSLLYRCFFSFFGIRFCFPLLVLSLPSLYDLLLSYLSVIFFLGPVSWSSLLSLWLNLWILRWMNAFSFIVFNVYCLTEIEILPCIMMWKVILKQGNIRSHLASMQQHSVEERTSKQQSQGRQKKDGKWRSRPTWSNCRPRREGGTLEEKQIRKRAQPSDYQGSKFGSGRRREQKETQELSRKELLLFFVLVLVCFFDTCLPICLPFLSSLLFQCSILLIP